MYDFQAYNRVKYAEAEYFILLLMREYQQDPKLNAPNLLKALQSQFDDYYQRRGEVNEPFEDFNEDNSQDNLAKAIESYQGQEGILFAANKRYYKNEDDAWMNAGIAIVILGAVVAVSGLISAGIAAAVAKDLIFPLLMTALSGGVVAGGIGLPMTVLGMVNPGSSHTNEPLVYKTLIQSDQIKEMVPLPQQGAAEEKVYDSCLNARVSVR